MTDLIYCREALRRVSRSFSIPISMLRPPLEAAVTCGYLLCRIADTIEDAEDLPTATRDALYAAFLDTLEGRAEPTTFVALAAAFGEGDEAEVARHLPRVMGVFASLPEASQASVARWVGEMTRGMAIYSRRAPDEDGVVALKTLEDLERYCYFVAGTVGHLLTELFVQALRVLEADRLRSLRAAAEEFGLGLQLVNVLKDVAEDRERGWSFVPTAVCEARGLRPADLTRPEHRDAAHEALAPVFERAHRALDGALAYTLAIPPAATDLRLFCLIPLWMAVRTLALLRGNDAQLRTESAKIDRGEVMAIIESCRAHCGDDEMLRQTYAQLAVGPLGALATAARA